MYDPASMSDASAATLEELSRLVRARGGARVGNLLPVSVPDNVQVRALTKAEFDALKQLVGAAE